MELGALDGRLMRRRCRLESGGSIPEAGWVPEAVTGQWGKAPTTIGGSDCNCTSDVRPTPNTPSKADNFQLNHHLWTSHRPSPLIKMRSTAALRMFRQTPRMLRPVPVSTIPWPPEPRPGPSTALTGYLAEGGPGWYVAQSPVDAHRTIRNTTTDKATQWKAS